MKRGNARKNGYPNTNKINLGLTVGVFLYLYFMGLFETTPLGPLLQKASSIDSGLFWLEIIRGNETQKFIIKLNTNQMKVDFVNAEGVQLSSIGGNYSETTMSLGGKSGESNVDLFDSGSFHESFKVIDITRNSFDITSNPITDNGINLFERWGEEVEGLNFDSLEELGAYLIPLYQSKLLRKLVV